MRLARNLLDCLFALMFAEPADIPEPIDWNDGTN